MERRDLLRATGAAALTHAHCRQPGRGARLAHGGQRREHYRIVRDRNEPGHPAARQDGAKEQQVQQGANPTTSALLGGALNATVSSRIGKLFGGGTVKIDPAFVGTLGNSSARITVQQQISRQITATFATNVNSSAQQLIQVQYDLTRNSSIVVTRDESGVFSVVYKLRRRYR